MSDYNERLSKVLRQSLENSPLHNIISRAFEEGYSAALQDLEIKRRAIAELLDGGKKDE